MDSVDPTGMVKESTPKDIRRMDAVYSVNHLTGEVVLNTSREDSVFRAAQRESVCTLRRVVFGAEEVNVDIAEIVFLKHRT